MPFEYYNKFGVYQMYKLIYSSLFEKIVYANKIDSVAM